MKTTFPESIEESIEGIIQTLNDIGFFDEDPIEETYIREEFGNFLMEQWKAGDEFRISYEDAEELLKRAAINSSIDRLQSLGIIDTIIDSDGTERFYLAGNIE
jgi:hypothetical protein